MRTESEQAFAPVKLVFETREELEKHIAILRWVAYETSFYNTDASTALTKLKGYV